MAGSNAVAKGLSMLGDRWSTFYEKNKAHIFTGLGIGGTFATGVLSARSGARSARKIDRRERELGRRLSTKEKVQLCWTDALAPGAVAIATGLCTLKSDIISTKIIADRTAMYLASEKAYEKLSQKTKEVIGEKKAKQIEDEIVKDKVTTAMQSGEFSMDDFDRAPKVGNGKLYRFVDEFTMLPFWSNLDYITLQVEELRKLMHKIEARGGELDYYDKEIGVYYSDWLRKIGYTDPKYIATEERKHLGWNKGYAKDGSQDDDINFFRTPIEYEPGVSVTAIKWYTDPSDMRLGRQKKSLDRD